MIRCCDEGSSWNLSNNRTATPSTSSFKFAICGAAQVLGPLYSTLYLTPWYRALGAKLGRFAEVSNASFISPDLLTLGDGSFIADIVSLGAARIEEGHITVDHVKNGIRAARGTATSLAG